jgi:hypothetical protein
MSDAAVQEGTFFVGDVPTTIWRESAALIERRFPGALDRDLELQAAVTAALAGQRASTR